jgi:hypothetical protein
MTSKHVRVAAALLPVLAVCACSFRGSVTDAQRSSSHSSSTSSSSDSSSSAGTTADTSSGATTAPAGSTSTAAGTTSAGPAGLDRCHTSELTAHLVQGGAGAGQRYATLILTDTGGQSCTIHGYGGLGLVDSSGHAVPTTQVRSATPAPTTVLLTPGTSVHSDLHWGAVPGLGEPQSGNCEPPAASLRVIPPDETDYLAVPWNLGSVCEHGSIDQQAYAR